MSEGTIEPGILHVPAYSEEPLTYEQRQRVAALKEARKVLEVRNASGPLNPRPGSEPPLTDELLTVARFIIDGTMPLSTLVEDAP